MALVRESVDIPSPTTSPNVLLSAEPKPALGRITAEVLS